MQEKTLERELISSILLFDKGNFHAADMKQKSVSGHPEACTACEQTGKQSRACVKKEARASWRSADRTRSRKVMLQSNTFTPEGAGGAARLRGGGDWS